MLFRFCCVGVFALVAWIPSLPLLQVCFAALALVLFFTVFLFFGCSRAASRALVVKCLCVFLLGLWAVVWGQWQLSHQLPASLDGRDFFVTGVIDSLVTRSGPVQRFDLRVESLESLTEGDGETLEGFGVPRKIRLSVYRGPDFYGGQGWRFQVRLKRPRGFANPGGFDYERWLLGRGVGATGYVKLNTPPQEMPQHDSGGRWRSELRLHLLGLVGRDKAAGLLVALAMGDRSLIEPDASQLVQQAGLSHLLAISGLHIGLAAGIGFLLGRWVGGCLAVVMPLRIFGPHVAWLGAIAVALGYAALAGFSLATQRALIMLLVGALWAVVYKNYSPWVGWWVSMLVVLILQPLSLLDAGFWFSFVAVAVLIFQLTRSASSKLQRFYLLVRVQLSLFLVMGALQLYWGMGLSLVSPVANLVAIPFVSLLVVPAILLALMLSAVHTGLSDWVWRLSDQCLHFFWWCLDRLAPWVEQSLFTQDVRTSPESMVLGSLALLIALVPGYYLTRCLAVFTGVFFLLLGQPVSPAHRMVVLDVGQGLAVLVAGPSYSMLYDTGPVYSSTFNAGQAVVLPYLWSAGVRRIDLGVVSHWDADHGGGFESLQQSGLAERWIFSQPYDSSNAVIDSVQSMAPSSLCRRDSVERLGGWTVYHIASGAGGDPNNLSCVLLLEGFGLRVLLPGDIERDRERQLLKHPWLRERVDIVVAPHHGSITSSTSAFVRQMRPRWVVYSAGHRNRYGHPHPRVIERYEQAGAQALSTAEAGAITFEFDGHGGVLVSQFRQSSARYWR